MAIDLRADKVVETVRRLGDRIRERFPDAGLSRVADQLLAAAEAAVGRISRIERPHVGLRCASVLLVLAIVASIGVAVLDLGVRPQAFRDLAEFVTFFQSAIQGLVFVGIGLAFVVTMENRVKRNRALAALHELRVLAHLVDMHQLDKDPVYLLTPGPQTKSSPKRTMTAFELNRYLDYCGELLSLTGKVAALYGGHVRDDVALSAVDQVESLTTGLARKIWQKEIMLDRAVGRIPAAGPG